MKRPEVEKIKVDSLLFENTPHDDILELGLSRQIVGDIQNRFSSTGQIMPAHEVISKLIVGKGIESLPLTDFEKKHMDYWYKILKPSSLNSVSPAELTQRIDDSISFEIGHMLVEWGLKLYLKSGVLEYDPTGIDKVTFSKERTYSFSRKEVAFFDSLDPLLLGNNAMPWTRIGLNEQTLEKINSSALLVENIGKVTINTSVKGEAARTLVGATADLVYPWKYEMQDDDRHNKFGRHFRIATVGNSLFKAVGYENDVFKIGKRTFISENTKYEFYPEYGKSLVIRTRSGLKTILTSE